MLPLPLLYLRLFQRYGHRFWWPGEAPFEVAAGAILVQNIQWKRVAHLLQTHPFLKNPDEVPAIPEHELSALLRPLGSGARKAGALKALARIFPELPKRSLQEARQALLDVKGIGPETADSILLYAFHRPIFVIDAYTRRILARLYGDGRFLKMRYDELRGWVEAQIPRDVVLYQDFHAQFVIHAQTSCRPRPRCETCVLWRWCLGRASQDLSRSQKQDRKRALPLKSHVLSWPVPCRNHGVQPWSDLHS